MIGLRLTVVGAMILLAGLTGCEPRRLPEFRNRKPDKVAIGKVIDSQPREVGVELPNGSRVYFSRKLTNEGFIDESIKTLKVVSADGKETAFDFGHGHSGYNAIEIRCSDDFQQVWVIEIDEPHMHSGAAIDLESGTRYPEQFGGWCNSWARPDNGLLVLRTGMP